MLLPVAAHRGPVPSHEARPAGPGRGALPRRRRSWWPWWAGCFPALLAALFGFLLLNWYFTPPVGRLTVSEPENLVALLVYVAVAVAVATVVDRASRRATEATRARTEAATLGALSRSVLTGQDTAEAIVERLRETFGQDAVALLARSPVGWAVVAASGAPCPATPDEGDTQVRVDDDHVLVLCGAALRATDQRVLEGFAVQTGLVLEYRRLRAREDRAAALESAEATSTALLRAVSHDLRTPLATMRASVDGLVSGKRLDPGDQAVLVGALAGSTDQLESLIDNLLDLSRLQSGLLKPRLVARSLDEVLPLAVAGHSAEAVSLEVAESVPLVRTDAGLLERVVANLVGNAVHVSSGTRSGCSPTCSPRPSRSWSSTGDPAYLPISGSGCSNPSSDSTTPRPAVWASAWRSPAG